eukprot:12434-Prorocentrum_minimum.AAC.1
MDERTNRAESLATDFVSSRLQRWIHPARTRARPHTRTYAPSVATAVGPLFTTSLHLSYEEIGPVHKMFVVFYDIGQAGRGALTKLLGRGVLLCANICSNKSCMFGSPTPPCARAFALATAPATDGPVNDGRTVERGVCKTPQKALQKASHQHSEPVCSLAYVCVVSSRITSEK